ncbi:MAG: HD domain-containing protein [Patescibacteria group bacterium]
MNILKHTAEKLVKERIIGTRKGLETPSCEHSIRVSKKLEELGYDSNIVLAGLLHDIIEDGDTTLEELKELGIPDNVVHLVDLCSHDASIKDSDDRWLSMMARIVKEGEKKAMAIKICDLMDNLSESDALKPERRKNMRLMKLPTLLRLSEDTMADTAVWKELHELAGEYIKQEIELLQKKGVRSEKLEKISDAFLEALNSVPKEDQY